MPSRRTHALAIFCALLATATASAQSSSYPTVPASKLKENLFGTCFIDDREGWAVGDLGRIFHTTDGGQTWEQQDAGTKRPFVAVACLDRTHVWAAGQTGQIAFSSDGGRTWAMQKSGVERHLLNIAFANPRRGLAVGDYGTVLRTDDGGETWTKVGLPADTRLPEDVAEVVRPGDVLLYGISFADPEHVWVVGEFGVILASEDGGQTFRAQNSPVETTLFGVYFTDPLHGWAAGLESTLLRTTDGGISWAKQNIETPKGFFLSLYCVKVRGDYGWAVGNSGLMLHTTDGGNTWQLADVPVQLRSLWFRDISLLPGGRGFIVGSSGAVLAVAGEQFTPLKKRF